MSMTRREFVRLAAGFVAALPASAALAAHGKDEAMWRYVDRIMSDLRRFRKEQLAATNAAGKRVAQRVIAGGRLLVFDQSGKYTSEALGRAGGLMAIAGVRDGSETSVHAPDALIVVSDDAAAEADLAVARPARERGALVVGICPMRAAAASLASACDIALDDHVSDEDACLTIRGLPKPIAPTSGAMNAAILWAVTAAHIESMDQHGRPPHVWMSMKRPGSKEFNDRELEATRREAADGAPVLPLATPVPSTRPRLAGEYLDVLERNLTMVVCQEWAHLEAGADVIARAIREGHKVYEYGAGHMIPGETAPGRRGRPDLFLPIKSNETSRLQPGDVLISSNQYGVWSEYVQVVIDAKERGALVVATAPRSDPKTIVRTHPSGTSVADHADVLIETHIPYGDAALDAPKGGPGSCPTSGTVQTVLYWALTCGVEERIAR